MISFWVAAAALWAVARATRPNSARERLASAPVHRGPAPPAWFIRALARSALPGSPERAWVAALASPLVGGLLGATVGGRGLAVIFALALPVGAAAWMHATRHRAEGQMARAVAPYLESVASSLRSGASVRGAVAEACAVAPAPLRGDLQLMADELAAGSSLSSALERWSDRHPGPEVRLAAVALALAVDAGGAAAESIDGVAATLRLRAAAAAEARALGSQARLSAAVIAVAPVVFAALTGVADRRSVRFLTGSPSGLVVLAVGLALDGLGAMWMVRLTAAVG